MEKEFEKNIENIKNIYESKFQKLICIQNFTPFYISNADYSILK
jgi:hypothetical protein